MQVLDKNREERWAKCALGTGDLGGVDVGSAVPGIATVAGSIVSGISGAASSYF